MTTAVVPRVSGGDEEHGHLEEFRTDPIGLMQRLRDECGDVGWFQLADKQVVLLTGSEANEFFFRSSDGELNQAEAYPFMTPIFGEGVVFDADPERRAEMLHNTALRGEQRRRRGTHGALLHRPPNSVLNRTKPGRRVQFFAHVFPLPGSARLAWPLGANTQYWRGVVALNCMLSTHCTTDTHPPVFVVKFAHKRQSRSHRFSAASSELIDLVCRIYGPLSRGLLPLIE